MTRNKSSNGQKGGPAKSGPKGTSNPKKKTTGVVHSQPNPQNQRKANIPKALVSTLCSFTDPFCIHAQGAQMRTSSSVRTFPHQLHQSYSLVTNALGAGAIMFLPGYAYLACFSFSTDATNALYDPMSLTNIGLTANNYRIVSAGYIVRKTVSPLNAAGMIRIRSFDAQTGVGFSSVSLSTFNCASYLDKPLADCHEVAVSARVIDAPEQEKLRTPNTTNPTDAILNWKSPGLGAVQIGVTGAPASQVVAEVEFFVNYEITFTDSDSMSLAAKTAPPSNPVIAAAKTQLSSTFSNIASNGIAQFGSMIERKAIEALGSALRPQNLMLLP